MTIARFLLALLLLTALPAGAQDFPKLTGRVVDAAGLLDAAQVQQLTALSDGVEKASSRQLVVATIPDLQGYTIEDYGYRLGRAWKIGQAGANNGVILLVAPKERKVRIEVGYGLEPIVTDAYASVVVNQIILPRFRDGDMPGGIVAGAQAVAEQLKLPLEAAERRAAEATAKRAQRSEDAGEWMTAIFWIVVVILFVVVPLLRRGGKGRRYRGGFAPIVMWGGGGFGGGGGGSSWGGGGGFSGGGGSFGGGGASGSW
ncbi:methanol dehydrogenase [Sphingomonas sp. Leaf412]|uniref:TPM domain-containing protein n=1 Tax=Sphingomonas sp. Leaf412 TaxID=1736370 RepID=UPI0006FC126A|nr:TPM domain-containing protein [Sphingomonas sp. Leaf412]KQT32545.1 methanol dehydrogenase [Sphingomonas sp. Leaf412]